MSTRGEVVTRYLEGFRESDHAAVLACLTDDVVWHVRGVRTTRGKEEFDSEIENPGFAGSPSLTVERWLEAGDTVVTAGLGIGHLASGDEFRFRFCTLYVFRGDLIAEVDSYVTPEA